MDSTIDNPSENSAIVSQDGRIFLNQTKLVKERKKYWAVKRAQDIVLSLLALVVLAIPMLIAAFVVWIDDPKGFPIYTQIRVGRNGREFKLYKFRSMKAGSEGKLDELLAQNEMDGPVFKIKNDPRITRVGRFMRKTGIDELPQLWNILKGDMSIVGPRPPLPREVALYNAYERQRLCVQPGLTCYWQIQPQRNSLSFEQWMEMDMRYIEDRSFLTDWKIIFMTVIAVLRREGE